MFLTAVIQAVNDIVNEITNKYKDMMHNLAFSILKDYQEAEDVVQDSLIALSKNTGKMDDINSARSKNYVYTVTKNKALEYYKRKKSKDVQFYDEKFINNIPGDLDVKAFCNQYGLSDRIMELLSSLDEIDKDIFVYKYGAGYSTKEIAEIIGRDREFVYKRMQRAERKLRQILKEG